MARKSSPKPPRESLGAEPPAGETTEHIVTFGEAFAGAVIDVVRPLLLRLPGIVIPTDGPGQEAIGAKFQWLSDQVSDLRREVEQLRIQGRRVPSKETLFEERMNKALQVRGLDRKAILAIWKIYEDLGNSLVSPDAKRQRRSRAARRSV
jgi:hypothetical protein